MQEPLYWKNALLCLDSLTVYRAVAKDELVRSLYVLCQDIVRDPLMTGQAAVLSDFISKLLERGNALGLSGNVLWKYLVYLLFRDENPFSLACERHEPVRNSTLYAYALRDMECLHFFSTFDVNAFGSESRIAADMLDFRPVTENAYAGLNQAEQASTPSALLEALLEHYTRWGTGEMASYAMFTLGGRGQRIKGVYDADVIKMSDIVGLQWQKEMIRENTEAFIAGKPANNMLLAGSRGNGKSSCVKALAHEYYESGLRLIEVRKDQAYALPALMNKLSERGKKFIIFMDDLSFEHFEVEYKYLKSVLEGGVNPKPKNVLFYATSNRRHIIYESWNDRNEKPVDGEIHATDTINEKLSLFDRFGVTVTFPNLSRDEYLSVVTALVQKRGLDIDHQSLTEQAEKWALSQKSVSGRTARQFVDHLSGM